jgi:hypothetical protein
MSEPWPYNLPIFRRAYRAVSPDGSTVAEINPAYEVSMSNPTIGVLTLSTGFQLDGCNPSFVWSDDSRYLAVPRYFHRLGLFRRQRLAIIDLVERRVVVSPQMAWYFQPESFSGGLLVATKEPARTPARRLSWRVPDELAVFNVLPVAWPAAAQPGIASEGPSLRR